MHESLRAEGPPDEQRMEDMKDKWPEAVEKKIEKASGLKFKVDDKAGKTKKAAPERMAAEVWRLVEEEAMRREVSRGISR
ncbi:hypothetical protein CRM93_02525 [Acetobacter fabarum]|uniref:Uncharacterized protein n=3 Tax=Acetobacter fabarum TaxID=483199 RepID=A0A269Y030_9PROT|nr:hypothetical protein B8X00_03110 [Acetobacter fabarum]PEN27951.1 hypothetical protein CRM93_02525 [Acetobacter fabarum]